MVEAAAALLAFAGAFETRPVRLELWPNFETVSVYAYIEGDEDSDGTAKLSFRRSGEEEFRNGQPLVRTGKRRWAGSLFFLRPDAEYEIKVAFEDPDGATPHELSGRTRTRSDEFPTGSGRVFHVRAGAPPGGDGTDEAPFARIQGAVDAAGPGDMVLVGEGKYRETVTIKRGGRADAWLLVRGDGAVLESQLQELDRKGAEWRERKRGIHARPAAFEVRYVSCDGKKLYGYGSYEDFEAVPAGPPGGFFYDKEKRLLWVFLSDGSSPSKHSLQVPEKREAFVIRAPYVIVEGFEVRYYWRTGIRIDAPDVVVRRNVVHNTDGGISMYSKQCHRVLIEENDVWQTSIRYWPWHKWTKGSRYELDAVAARGGRGNVIRRNCVHGSFDGVGQSLWGRLEDEDWIRDTDVHDNDIWDCRDDGFEPEGACMNLRFWRNRIWNSHMGMSLAPITVGPCWVIRDVYWDYESSGIKSGVSSRGPVFLYHLTVFTDRPGQNAVTWGGPASRWHFRNCIFRGAHYVLEDCRSADRGITLDYDCLYVARESEYQGTRRFVKWRNRRYWDFPSFQRAGFEEHGLCADPLLRAPGEGEFSLLPESPLVDRGVRLANINDGFAGKGPDIGAREAGLPYRPPSSRPPEPRAKPRMKRPRPLARLWQGAAAAEQKARRLDFAGAAGLFALLCTEARTPEELNELERRILAMVACEELKALVPRAVPSWVYAERSGKEGRWRLVGAEESGIRLERGPEKLRAGWDALNLRSFLALAARAVERSSAGEREALTRCLRHFGPPE